MQISSYNDSYLDLLTMLHETQESETLLVNLPKIGYIVTEGAIPVAAGFLRLMEGGYAIFDTVVTNGDLDSDMRHEGISMLVNMLILAAKEHNIKGLVGITHDSGIISRAKDLNFTIQTQSILVLPLTHKYTV